MYSNSYIYNWPDVAKLLYSVFCVKMISNELIKKVLYSKPMGKSEIILNAIEKADGTLFAFTFWNAVENDPK